MTGRKGKPKGDTTAYVRMQRMRKRRKAQGWQPYELWLPPDSAALLAELKQPGESFSAVVDRALRHLKAQAVSDLNYDARLAALMARIWAMYEDDKLSTQEIATRFNEAHEPTLSRRGQWQAGTVGKLLKTYPRGT